MLILEIWVFNGRSRQKLREWERSSAIGWPCADVTPEHEKGVLRRIHTEVKSRCASDDQLPEKLSALHNREMCSCAAGLAQFPWRRVAGNRKLFSWLRFGG